MNVKIMAHGNSGRTAKMIVVSLVIVLLAVGAAVGIVRLGEAVRDSGRAVEVQRSTTVTIENDGYSTYTERYYEAAAAREVALDARAALDKQSIDYLARYYQLAAEPHKTAASVLDEQSVDYIARYYQLAAEPHNTAASVLEEQSIDYIARFYYLTANPQPDKVSAEREDDGYAFFTERYYDAAAAREAAVTAEADDDYAFYTERYWQAAAAREAAPRATR